MLRAVDTRKARVQRLKQRAAVQQQMVPLPWIHIDLASLETCRADASDPADRISAEISDLRGSPVPSMARIWDWKRVI